MICSGVEALKKRIITISVFLVFAAMLAFGFISAAVGSGSSAEYNRKERLYSELSEKQWNVPKTENMLSVPLNRAALNGKTLNGENGFSLKKGDKLVFAVPDNNFEKYKIGLRYKIDDDFGIDALFDIKAGEKEYVGFLPKIWTDADKIFRLDEKGNEIASSQIGSERFTDGFISDYQAPGKGELEFSDKGGTKIVLSSQYVTVEIEEVFIYRVTETVSYSDYKAAGESDDYTPGNAKIRIEAEEYSIKSASSIHGSNLNSIKAYPYNTYKRLINVLQGTYWSQPGQKVMWEFNVEKSGWYNIGFRYSLGGEAGKSSYRTVEIDGEAPFREFESVSFKSTNSDYKFKNIYLADKDGSNFKIFLSAGTHTIALKNTVGGLEEIYYELKDIMSELNDIGLDLQRLTAGSTDMNRTWDMELYMPDAIGNIKELKNRISAAHDKLCLAEGTKANYANNLVFAIEQIDRLLENTRTIPNNTALLSVGDDSAAKYVGTVLTKLISQPLTLDCIYFSETDGFDGKTGGFAASAKDSLIKFCYSYLPEKKTDGKNKTEVEVWMSRNMQYVQMLSELLNEQSGELDGIEVKLSVMQDKQKLVLANASGSNPDAVLSVAIDTPFDFAIRNAAKDFTEYSDFADFYTKDYSAENLVPASFNGGVYGLPESVDCKLLYYRTDILEKLGLEVPDTWDDVKKMMPVLLGNLYNFYIPLSSSAGFKSYDTTSPFVYQNGGRFFSEDGLSSAVNTEETVKGIKEMTDIFNIYSFQKAVPNFYNSFRYGEIPIGVSGLGTYVQLLVAAPELNGLWDVAPTPGTVQQDGSVKRYQTASAASCMIFKNTKVSDEAWSFIKWWLSEKTQLNYAQSMERIYGTSYRYNTANLKALASLEYPEKHKAVISEQLEHQKEVPRHPANYMVEREISNIWNTVVVDGGNLQETIDKAEINANREINRKMQEFGFIDSDGKVLKEYNTDLKIIGKRGDIGK